MVGFLKDDNYPIPNYLIEGSNYFACSSLTGSVRTFGPSRLLLVPYLCPCDSRWKRILSFPLVNASLHIKAFMIDVRISHTTKVKYGAGVCPLAIQLYLQTFRKSNYLMELPYS